MNGIVALLGGNEHTPGCEVIDRLLLRSTGVARAEVAVILAASPDYRRAFKRTQAETWWAHLGARARCAFAGEADPVGQAAALLETADLIVVTGGRPWLLWRRLVRTELGGLVRQRWRAGVTVAGSSAGAMVLADAAWSLTPAAPLVPRPGLGLVPRVLVAPHAGRHGVDRWARRTQAAHPELDVLGIPDRTAVVVRGAHAPEAVGTAPVVSYGTGAEWRDGGRALGWIEHAPDMETTLETTPRGSRGAPDPGAAHRSRRT